MNKKVLSSPIQEFIKGYKGDIAKLAFSGSPFLEVSVQELIQQIEGRHKAKNKLNYILDVEGIYFPPKLNLEQTSSEQTALYKATLIPQGTIADLTGGFGIDTFHFSRMAKEVAYFELNTSLCKIAKHNFECLNALNISVENSSGLSILKENKKYNTIYIDPSRRTESKQKVFFLNDCEPNVPGHIDTLLTMCDVLMIKTSPMLDLQVGLQELQGVYEIHVIAVNNEVKELLWLCKKEESQDIIVKAINLKKNDKEVFLFSKNTRVSSQFAEPSNFLYEPNAAILKAGGFSHISEKLALSKLHKHSHLFTSETLQEFPGRAFKIDGVIPYNKKEIKTHIASTKANVTTRNFPETVANLRKKWKLKDGGNTYLFFTTLKDDSKVVLKCSKIKA